MLDDLRTILAKFIVRHLHSPAPPRDPRVVLATEADDLDEKRGCTEASAATERYHTAGYEEKAFGGLLLRSAIPLGYAPPVRLGA